MRVQEGLYVLGARCLVCQDPVSSYFHFVSLPLGLSVICVILHTIWSGKSQQLICILIFGILCLSAIRMIFVKIIFAVCVLVGIVV